MPRAQVEYETSYITESYPGRQQISRRLAILTDFAFRAPVACGLVWISPDAKGAEDKPFGGSHACFTIGTLARSVRVGPGDDTQADNTCGYPEAVTLGGDSRNQERDHIDLKPAYAKMPVFLATSTE